MAEFFCDAGHRWDVLPNFPEPEARERCPVCGEKAYQQLGFHSPAVLTAHMTADEAALHLKHKRHLEANPDAYEWKEKGPLEFRPQIPRTVF